MSNALSGDDIWRFIASVGCFWFVLFFGICAFRLQQQLCRYGFHQFLFGSSLMLCKGNRWGLEAKANATIVGQPTAGAQQLHEVHNSHPIQWSVCMADTWAEGRWRFSVLR